MDNAGEFDWLDDQDTQTVGGDSFDWLEDGYSLESPVALENSLLLERTVSRRQTVMAEKEHNLAQLITALPPLDTDLFIIGAAEGKEHSRTGHILANAFDFGSFVGHCINLLLAETGKPGGVTLYVSTWIWNRDFNLMIADMLNDGRLYAVHVLGDKFVKRRHTSAIYAQMVEIIQSHPPSRIRLAPNHVKALCMTVARRYVSITGSANLSAVARTEQYNLTTSPQVYQFYVNQFFEEIFSRKVRRT